MPDRRVSVSLVCWSSVDIVDGQTGLLRQRMHESRLKLHLVPVVGPCKLRDRLSNFVLELLPGKKGARFFIDGEKTAFVADEVLLS